MFKILHTVFAGPQITIGGETQQKDQKRRYGYFIKGGISIFLMWWVLKGTNGGDIFLLVRSASVPLLVCGFSLPFIGYFLSVSRWRILLSAQGISSKRSDLLGSFMISLFFNNFLPSTIGGDVFRAYESWRLGATKASAVAVVVVDRLLGLAALLVLAVIGLMAANPFAGTIPFLPFLVLGGFCGVAAVGVFLFHSSFPWDFKIPEGQSKWMQLGRGLATKVSNGFSAFRGKLDTLTRGFGLSLLLQGNVVLQYFVFAEALHYSVSFLGFLSIIPLALLVTLLPVSINGIGLRESVFVLFLSPWGIDKPEALALAWLAYGSYVIHGLFGGVVYGCRK